jgi:hypothetical protein
MPAVKMAAANQIDHARREFNSAKLCIMRANFRANPVGEAVGMPELAIINRLP